MKKIFLLLLVIALPIFAKFNFKISFSKKLTETAQDGRLLLLLSANNKSEPRFQVSDALSTQLVFGVDVDGMLPEAEIIIDETAFGYPIESLKNVPTGEYFVQAVINRYETFKLKTGHVVKLPPDKGEGQHWNTKPGNYYSTPQKINFNSAIDQTFSIKMENEIAPIKEPTDTKYIKHVKMQSKLLTEFWGRPMYLGANILIPDGFDEHPEAKYPLMIFHGHFPSDFGGFREVPPDPNLPTNDYSDRFKIYGYNKIVQEEAHNFYKKWTSKDFPRFIIIEIQHATPYYDDSYAVNSASQGPWGDAITYELIPFIEKKFRGIGEGWARFLYGGSTGGWEALAAQVFYPEEYNGCFAACPDPIDFRAYTSFNIYKDKNAYQYESQFKKLERPAHRDYLGQLSTSVRQTNYRELALGTKSRSGDQYDIWEATYSPQDVDGYPKRIFDKYTGEIDSYVANYWRDNFDLRYIMERDWKTLGPKLKGKINIYCGDMDNYYLNNAVYLTEDFLEKTKEPYYSGEVDYGDRAEHCWNGDQENPNYISRLRYNSMYVPKILKRIEESAPKGADLKSWRY